MGTRTIDDLLLSQYIKELSTSQTIVKRCDPSPYKLPLRHTNILTTHRGILPCHSSRSQSSKFGKCDSARSRSSGPTGTQQKTRLSIAGNGLNEGESKQRTRNKSVDREDIANSTNGNLRRSSHSRNRRTRSSIPAYLQVPAVYVVTAFKNGDRSRSARVSAPNFEKLLEQCTIKLGLPSSARKLFLGSGKEVPRVATVPRGTEIYVSMGEAFKDPAKLLEKRINMGADVQWNLNGINLPSDREREATKPVSTPRGLSDQATRRRILIFANGKGTNGIEILANISNIDELKYNCTLKFNFGQHIKRILLTDGTDVENIESDIPEIDPLLNNSHGTPLLGPVWASKGEDISPMGVEEYLRDVIRFVKQKRKVSRDYRVQLRLVYTSDDRESLAKDMKLTNKRILSMSDDEIQSEIGKESEKIQQYNAFLETHELLLEYVEPEAKNEQEEGSKFTMKHIRALPEKHSLVSGSPGLRVIVFMNGKDSDPVNAYFNIQEASRGLKKDKNRRQIVFQRFLDCLSANSLLAHKNSKSKGILVRRVFTKTGTEITDAMTIEQEQQIWISHGEDWIDPFTYCMQAEISKVTELKKGDRRFAVVRSEVPQIDEKSTWKAQLGVPDSIEQISLPEPEPKNEEEEEPQEEEKPPEESVPDDGCFLVNSKNRQLCLFVEPVVGAQRLPKEAPNAGDGGETAKHVWPVWPRTGISQIWVVHKSGQITLKNFKIALTLVDANIETNLQGATMRGRLVQFTPIEEDRVPATQRWNFSKDGLIYSQLEPELVLTYLGGLVDEPHTRPKNELNDTSLNYRNMLAACEPLTARDDVRGKLREQLEKYQRFGLRLSKFENFSTWRKAGEGNENDKCEKHKDPNWSKLALLWPTDKDGEIIDDLDWPLECHMLAFAPPLKEFKPETDSPKRFFCLKNGERKEQFGVFVTAPDLTNMKKQKKLSKKKSNRKHQAANRQEETDSFVGDDYIHVPNCSDITVQQVEFKIFLECCTNLLGLSSAARRLFDENGIEHNSLEKFDRDQKLYVSVGEPWADPRYSKQQLEARSMLVKLAEDVDKIRSFVALKETKALVIAAESLTAGSKLGVSRDLLTKRERRTKQLQESQSPPDANFDSSDEDEEDNDEEGLTAHQRACRRSDEKRSGLKWPWEKIVSNDLDQSAEDSAERQAPVPVKKRKENKNLSLKQFVLEDGVISAKENPNLVLTAVDSPDARVLEVTLEKRVPDNLYQRWQLNNNGSISLKYRPASVLTVKLPTVTQFSSEIVDIESSVLTVQPLKSHQFGRAHQLFAVDTERSTICCFATTDLDVSVTSANQSGCCTYYVSTVKGECLDQPGYITFLETRQQQLGQESRFKKCSVCVSCAKSLRGKYKLQKIAPGARTDFACAFGKSAELGLKERGSFAILNDKIDLAEGEDKATLKRWEEEIQVQRSKLSVKAIANRLSEAQTPRPIRVLAYRNGDGRLCKPVPVYGTSVRGIMDQCASKLRISWAVRKLYLEDGTPVLDLDDLRNWCATHAKQVRMRQKEIEEGCLQPEMDKIRDEVDKTGAPRVDDPTPENSPRRPAKLSKRDSLEPRLKEKYIVIGSNLTVPTAYTMTISLYSINFMNEILPQENLDSEDTEMIIRYSVFDQIICTNPFTNEDSFEGEQRDIQIKSDLPMLRRFFKEKFSLLKFDLVRMPEETVLATSYVPLDTLVREEHEEFIDSAKVAANYAWYKKTAEKPKGQRTQASLHVEIIFAMSIDDVVDNDDDSSEAGEFEDSQWLQNEAADANPNATPGAAEEAIADPAQPDESADSEEQPPAPDPHELYIELWASTGEAFVPLRQAHREFRKMAQQRKDLRQVLNSKDADKHILKMMQGRRLQAQEPGTFRSTTDPQNPVVVEGGWQTPKGEEVMIGREIGQLEDKEAKIRERHGTEQSQPRRAAFDFDRQLYRQSSMLRLRVFANGEDPKTATTVWAETIHQVLDTATTRLGLRKPARILFSLDGKDVHDMGQLSRDQLLCVSGGEPYQPPGSTLETVEIKANWGRAKRQYGPGATNFHVQARGHPLVGVDPFGPPLHSAKPPPQSLPMFDTRRVRVFENGRAIGQPESVFGDSMEALLAAATKRLNLRNPAVCFYNAEGHKVVSFNEISRDDLLYASTTNKGFIRPERR